MKKSHFLGDWWFLCDLLCHFWWIFGWDWGTPAILRQNPNIYGQFEGKLGFGQFWKKKLGLGQTPPPLGQIPNFYRKFVLGAPLICIVKREATGVHFNWNIIRTNEYVCFGLIWYWHDITSIKHTNSSFLCSLLNPSFHTNINRLESFVVVVCSLMAVDMCSWNRSSFPHRPHLNFW